MKRNRIACDGGDLVETLGQISDMHQNGRLLSEFM